MMDIAKHIAIRVATPEAIGSGFYLRQYDLVITCEHLVRDYDEVVIEGHQASRQLVSVLYTDATLDIALLQPRAPLDIPLVDIESECEEEQSVYAYAYPFTEGEMQDTGYIDDPGFGFHGHPHIMHDAFLGNSANGSALFTETGALLGKNNFMNYKGRSIGMALPISEVVSSIEQFRASGYSSAVKCSGCQQIVDRDKNAECMNCGNIFDLPNSAASYNPKGVARTIETLLRSMGYILELARIGRDHWEVERGSAQVNITYYEKNGLIIGDAYICKLPDQSNTELYEFLLRQNYEMENLTFSVKGNDIILSLLIYDRYLNEQTGTQLLTNLLEKADYFDNILVDQYQCLWASSRKLT